MTYILVLTLPAGQKVGVSGLTASEITFDLLGEDGVTRTNPNAVNIAPRSTSGLPDEATILSDIAASLPA